MIANPTAFAMFVLALVFTLVVKLTIRKLYGVKSPSPAAAPDSNHTPNKVWQWLQ
jgi:hypothetical protein